MIVLGVLQNMWVRDPIRTRALFERHPEARRRFITYALFAGCRTGRVLRQVFGEDCSRRIVWDEASREIAGNPRDVFPADVEHLRAVLEEVKPQVVLAFGRVAAPALELLVPGDRLLIGPHPTARQADTLQRLGWMAESLENMRRRAAKPSSAD